MIDSLFFLDENGAVLIEKHYRGARSRRVCDLFMQEIVKVAKLDDVLPVMKASDQSNFVHIQFDGYFIVALCRGEVPPLFVLSFLHTVRRVLHNYFGKLNESTIRSNFSTIYQILDEMMDNGVPFRTEDNHLTTLVPPVGAMGKLLGGLSGRSAVATTLSDTALPWRKNVSYPNRNEITFDMIETIDCILESSGMLVQARVHGVIECVCRLSGMPDITIDFNNANLIDDAAFHQCVRLKQWDSSKRLSFVPPDGPFSLMEYRCEETRGLQLPVYAAPKISFAAGGVGTVSIMVGTKALGGASQVENVALRVQFPQSVASSSLSADYGTVDFNETTKECTWKIGKIDKMKTPVLQGQVQLTTGAELPAQNPLLYLDFKVDKFGASGLNITNVGVLRVDYKPFKGKRQVTQSGRVQIRS